MMGIRITICSSSGDMPMSRYWHECMIWEHGAQTEGSGIALRAFAGRGRSGAEGPDGVLRRTAPWLSTAPPLPDTGLLYRISHTGKLGTFCMPEGGVTGRILHDRTVRYEPRFGGKPFNFVTLRIKRSRGGVTGHILRG